MFIFDLGYILWVLLPGLLLGMWAQARVRSAYAEASQFTSRSGLSGAQVAAAIVQGAGIADVTVEPTEGFLSDHYHPLAKALRLSQDNFGGRSLAAIGVAAHEAGHAVQHAQGYWPLQLRSALVPACQVGQWIGQLAMMLGLVLWFAGIGQTLLMVAILGYAAVFAFTLVTLPVEFDASRRALAVLGEQGYLTPDELPVVRRVLSAAALTYVASAVQVLLVLLYLISLLNRRQG